MSIDTLRVLVGWKCNLKCAYCCNERPEIRRQFRAATIEEIDWPTYQTICISGGEPLLFPDHVVSVLQQTKAAQRTVLYTNGFKCETALMRRLQAEGLQFVNVGLHYPGSFDSIIARVVEAVTFTSLRVRFHAQEIYRTELERKYPDLEFRFWKMDDCDRDNEDRIILRWVVA